jgi:hypothetical protein
MEEETTMKYSVLHDKVQSLYKMNVNESFNHLSSALQGAANISDNDSS